MPIERISSRIKLAFASPQKHSSFFVGLLEQKRGGIERFFEVYVPNLNGPIGRHLFESPLTFLILNDCSDIITAVDQASILFKCCQINLFYQD
jgi:hypothetical protein